MYYLLNHTNQIIAADDSMLALCGVSHIDQLTSKLILGEITIAPTAKNTILINGDQSFSTSRTILSSLLGRLTLVTLESQTQVYEDAKPDIIETPQEEVPTLEEVSTDSTDPQEPKRPSPEIPQSTETLQEEALALTELLLPEEYEKKSTQETIDVDEILNLNDADTPEKPVDSEDSLLHTEKDTDPITLQDHVDIPDDFSHIFDTAPSPQTEPSKDKESTHTPSEQMVEPPMQLLKEDTRTPADTPSVDESFAELLLPSDDSPTTVIDDLEIYIDIDNVSAQIGISHEDYNQFLDEYIDTALGLEEEMRSSIASKRDEAITTLSQLGEMLRLPAIDEIIHKLQTASGENQGDLIDTLYHTLSRLTTQKSVQVTTEAPELTEPTLSVKEPEPLEDLVIPQEDIKTINTLQAAKEEEKADESKSSEADPLHTHGFGTISLEGIKPIHFDFQLEEAANDLSLPVELIEEFVHDFIDQAHSETKKMLEAYRQGDLETIQKIGHLLKGAASNLRINPLADTLYQIQFCEDPSLLEGYITAYWGHFLSFEIKINALAK